MKRLIIILLIIFAIPNLAHSQKTKLAINAGAGANYGGMGTKVTLIRPHSIPGLSIGLTAGLGYYYGPVLSSSIWSFDYFNRHNLKGVGFSVGVDFLINNGYYIGFQFIKTGNHTHYSISSTGTAPRYGISYTFIGGIIPIGKKGLFLDLAGYLSFIFPNKIDDFNGLLGMSIGIGYMFGI